jgi:hypothetical protein
MFKDFTRAHIIASVSTTISLIVMIFGNNFDDKWQKAELYYTNNEVKIEYSQKFINQSKSFPKDSLYYYFQQIQVMNLKKKPATNLTLFINTDGIIKYFKVYSIEDTLEAKISNGIMKIKVDRLVKDADITFKFWFTGKPGSLSIQYIDDNGLRSIKDVSQFKNIDYFGIVGLITFSLTILWILHSNFLAPVFANRKELRLQNIDLQQKYDSANDELEQLIFMKTEIETDDPSDFLNKFLAKYKNSGGDK